MADSTLGTQEIATLARTAGLSVPAERLDTLASDLAAARAMMAEVQSVATDLTPIPYRPDWSEPTGDLVP